MGEQNSGIIEKKGKSKGTHYFLNGRAVPFVGPERSFIPKAPVPTPTPENVVSFQDYSGKMESRKKEDVERHFASRKRNPINVRERIRGILDSFEATGVTFPIKGYKLWSGYFKNIEPKFQQEMLSRNGALKPEKSDDHHPNYTGTDTAVMLFTKAANEFLQRSGWDGLRAIIEEELEYRTKSKDDAQINKSSF
jgi:hypothetical protein